MVASGVLAGAALVANLEAHARGWIFSIALASIVAATVIAHRRLLREERKLKAFIIATKYAVNMTNEELARELGLSLSDTIALRTEMERDEPLLRYQNEMSGAPGNYSFTRAIRDRREAHVVYFPPRSRSPRS